MCQGCRGNTDEVAKEFIDINSIISLYSSLTVKTLLVNADFVYFQYSLVLQV